jgi:hypothetical protein
LFEDTQQVDWKPGRLAVCLTNGYDNRLPSGALEVSRALKDGEQRTIDEGLSSEHYQGIH